MTTTRLLLTSIRAVAVLAMALFFARTAWPAPKYKVLHAFGTGTDGGGLWGSLAFDARGNLYGTTSGGGTYGGGTVFVLTPQPNGIWNEKILHSFPASVYDGAALFSAPILDAAGNLYASTATGGTHNKGTVFELAHAFSSKSVLYDFCTEPRCADGGSPAGNLTMDALSNLYGTAFNTFELSPGAGGWRFKLLHTFPSYTGDGSDAVGGVIPDASGNVYGVTEGGGTGTGPQCLSTGCGTVYELQPMPEGVSWKEIVVHDFGTDGLALPAGALAFDSKGDLYGGVALGGGHGFGAVYRLTPGTGGHWKISTLYSFTGGADGGGPNAGVVIDESGNLYGVSASGGDPNCACGVVYKLAPGSGGKWTYTALHTFTGYDGAQPYAALILDSQGNLYGTTATGGAGGSGVAFEITP